MNAAAHDAIIVGAGPVGQFLALAAARQGLRILVLEARPSAESANDNRTLALSHGSWLMLDRAGIAAAAATHATTIDRIHISQRGGPGRTELSAAECGLPALGHVIGYGALQAVLASALDGRVTVRRGSPVTLVTESSNTATVRVGTEEWSAPTVIIAEGGGTLLESLGYRQEAKDYGTCALVARVQTDRPHEHIAYERFSRQGPIALLPRDDGFALVWTLDPEAAQRTAAMPTGPFLDALQTAFGWRAGRFVQVGERGTFPLALRRTSDGSPARIVVLGNAAQTLHPVAGQGLNLGLRDAWAAATTLGRDGRIDAREFGRSRRRDRGANARFTDLLAELFVGTVPGLALARGAGLAVLDTAPGMRRLFTRALSFGSVR